MLNEVKNEISFKKIIIHKNYHILSTLDICCSTIQYNRWISIKKNFILRYFFLNSDIYIKYKTNSKNYNAYSISYLKTQLQKFLN